MVTRVDVTKRAEQSLEKVPRQVAAKFFYWKRQIEEHGLETIAKISGYHDEPLQGKLRGVRSVRMALGYRAFYRLSGTAIKFVLVEEVNRHDYKKIERLLAR